MNRKPGLRRGPGRVSLHSCPLSFFMKASEKGFKLNPSKIIPPHPQSPLSVIKKWEAKPGRYFRIRRSFMKDYLRVLSSSLERRLGRVGEGLNTDIVLTVC